MKLHLPEDRRRRRLTLLAIAAAVIGAYVLISRLVPHGELHELLEDVSNTLGSWTYLLVGVVAFAETGAFVGLVVPGETLMLFGGAVAGQGAVDLYLLIAIAWFAAWAGDTTSFFIGRRLGRDFVLRHGPRFGIGHERFEGVERYFKRHGGKTIFLGRFVSLVRAFAPFIAGSSGMAYRYFVPYSILGTGLWATSHMVLGYVFSRSIDTAAEYVGRGVFLLGTLIVVVVGTVALVRHFRRPENRRAAIRWMDRHAATRWIVAIGRRFRPQLQFLWNRVTPGGTFGLEFTSLMAILAVASFVLIAYTVVVTREPAPTPGDLTARDIAEALRTAWLVSVAKAVTVLGAGPLVWALTMLSAGILALRRRWAEVGVLLAGLAMIVLGVHELKDTVGRPRPEGGLVGFSGGSFPSGHAAYSTFYVWLAVTLVIRLRPGMARGALVITLGMVLTVLIGLSRIFLGVHYFSDVASGWAAGAIAFSLCATAALVITTLRHNADDASAPGTSAAAAGAAED